MRPYEGRSIVVVRDTPLANVYMWWEGVQVGYGIYYICAQRFLGWLSICWLVRCCVELENGRSGASTVPVDFL